MSNCLNEMIYEKNAVCHQDLNELRNEFRNRTSIMKKFSPFLNHRIFKSKAQNEQTHIVRAYRDLE
jgi:hypothetical protein